MVDWLSYTNQFLGMPLKDVCEKTFYAIDFLQTSTADKEWITCFRNEKKIGGHGPRFRDKGCGKLVWFWKIAARKSARSPGLQSF